MNRRHQEQGIALITTLIMLSVVTLMAVTFLAVSRRERSSVVTTSDRIDARAIAEAAYQRAEAESVAGILATTNLFNYGFRVSTNFLNGAGFQANVANIANVSYRYPSGDPVEGDDLLLLYRNLQIDPRVPVFVPTNAATGREEFRYYLDFNRNGLYETNGVQVELDRNGRSTGFTNFFVGDPEWVGVLRRPDLPHSGSNLFVGRYAYLILPAGKSLDLNFLHNQSKRLGSGGNPQDGFFRNQGVGSWELNLAAFLRDLNTNAWDGYLYRTSMFTVSGGIAFDNALSILRERYRTNANDAVPSFQRLASVQQLYGAPGAIAFERDGNDGYGDGPLQLGIERPYTISGGRFDITDNDDTLDNWPGADNPSQYFDPQELFTLAEPAGVTVFNRFTNRLANVSTANSTYDRHTFYRLLSQLGTDSVPSSRGQINLNFDNRLDLDSLLSSAVPGPNVGYHASNFVAWTPSAFFTNAADRILKYLHPQAGRDVPLVSVTNIQIWPTNYYSPAVHRSLQVAANIYDAMTNRPQQNGFPILPSVFRPGFGVDPAVAGGWRVQGYRDATYEDPNNLWNAEHLDLDIATNRNPSLPNFYFDGMPVVIGAKKGFPNFNEFELQTVAVATRKLEVGKASPLARPTYTNQLYTLGISNVLGVEFWNSYERPYPRTLELRARVEYDLVLSNDTRVVRTLTGASTVSIPIPANQWLGKQFRIPIQTNILFLPMSAYRFATGTFTPVQDNRVQDLFQPSTGWPIPVWRLSMTNRVRAMLIDTSETKAPDGTTIPGRVIDYVDLDNLNSVIDITRELFGVLDDVGQTSVTGSFWRTNRVNGIPQGVISQIQASMGALTVSQWNSAASDSVQGQDKEKAIERFRAFIGMSGLPSPPSSTLRMQAPFSPGIKLLHQQSWQANDPLVNKLYWDLEDPARTNVIERLPPLFEVTSERSNIGKINQRYRPWQRNQYSSGDRSDFDVAFKDPQITKSDDWDFPTNALPTVGWLGRIHRGTPWQTLYLKSKAVTPQQWRLWSGHPDIIWPRGVLPPGTQPTNDWRIVDLFTTAVGDNAARGLLSVNQEGLAAWSAVLSGIPVLTNFLSTNIGPLLIEPNTPELRSIVSGLNIARQFQFGQKFNYKGEILATPELSVASPYLRLAASVNGTPPDAVVERIPQMMLSLIKADEPRLVIYAFGQSLRPAPGAVVTDFGPYFQMPTNYVITGEYVTKTLVRLESFIENGRLRIRPIKESYNEVPPTE